MDDLAALCPPGRPVAAGGEQFNITPLRVRQIGPLVRALGPAWGKISAGADVAAVMMAHQSALVEAVGILLDKPAEWVADLPLGDLLDLAEALVEANRDFFVRRILPLLVRMNAAGLTLSSGSSGTGTASPT